MRGKLRKAKYDILTYCTSSGDALARPNTSNMLIDIQQKRSVLNYSSHKLGNHSSKVLKS